MKKFAVLAAVAAVGLGTSMAHAIAITVGTSGVYASGVGTPGNIVNLPDAGTFVGQVSRSTFTSDLATAFAANRGGTVTFDSGFTNAANYGEGSGNAITATFGTGSVGFYRTDVLGTATTPIAPGFFAIQPNNNNVAGGTASGGTAAANGGYLGLAGNFGIAPGSAANTATQDPTAGGGVNLGFSTGLSEVGLSLVPRGSDRNVILTALLDNGTTLVSSSNLVSTNNTSTPSGGTATTGSGGIFYGFIAPTGRTITGLRLNEAAAGFARFDDLGLILPAATPGTPEPAALSLLGLSGLAVLRRKRA